MINIEVIANIFCADVRQNNFQSEDINCRKSIFINILFSCLLPDVDDCSDSTHNCDTHATCSNTIGSFTCQCNTGYEGDGAVCSGNLLHLYIHIKSKNLFHWKNVLLVLKILTKVTLEQDIKLLLNAF